MRKIKIRIFQLFFLFLVIRFFLLKNQRFSGDGILTVNPSPIPFLNTCHVLFDKIEINKGINSRKYNFKNIPCYHMEVRLYSFLQCPGETEDYFSYNADIVTTNEISEIFETVSARVGIEIYDDQVEYISIERELFHTSFNFDGGKWFLISDGGPVTWRYDDVSLSSFKNLKGKDYEFEVSVELEKNIDQYMCIQPFMIGGTSFNL